MTLSCKDILLDITNDRNSITLQNDINNYTIKRNISSYLYFTNKTYFFYSDLMITGGNGTGKNMKGLRFKDSKKRSRRKN